MTKLINTLTSEQAAATTGKIINLIIAVTGAIYCIYGIYLQVTNNF